MYSSVAALNMKRLSNFKCTNIVIYTANSQPATALEYTITTLTYLTYIGFFNFTSIFYLQQHL